MTRHKEGGDGEITPVDMPRVDTGRINLSLLEATQNVGKATGVSSDDVITKLADEVARITRAHGGPPPAPPAPPKKFLAVEHGKWVQMIAALLVAGVGLALTWVLFVRDDLKDLRKEQEHHEVHGHEDTDKAIGDIKDEQIIQGEKLKSIGKDIKDIKSGLKD